MLLNLMLLVELQLLLKLLLLELLLKLEAALNGAAVVEGRRSAKICHQHCFLFPFRVIPPFEKAVVGPAELSAEEVARMGDVRALVGQLYEALHVEEHQVGQNSHFDK